MYCRISGLCALPLHNSPSRHTLAMPCPPSLFKLVQAHRGYSDLEEGDEYRLQEIHKFFAEVGILWMVHWCVAGWEICEWMRMVHTDASSLGWHDSVYQCLSSNLLWDVHVTTKCFQMPLPKSKRNLVPTVVMCIKSCWFQYVSAALLAVSDLFSHRQAGLSARVM